MKRIVFIAKTNLNTDGRILNQIKILEEEFPNAHIDFILMPDKPLTISLGKNVKIHNINTTFRNNNFMRFFTALEFMVKSLILLLKLKPQILHAQDTSIVQPVLLYRLLKGSSFKLIYDDHEIPNENEPFFKRVFNTLEVYLMKNSDHVIFANKERMEVLIKKHHLKGSFSYFLNLPYFENESELDCKEDEVELKYLDQQILKGVNYIIHQGPLHYERGREKLAKFSKILPKNYKILLLGGEKSDFISFLNEFDVDDENFYFRGTVNYLVLPNYWERGVASVVMYLPTYINNRLCAPNRFYISLQKGLPVIVNKNNPVLSNFIKDYECGVFIEDLDSNNIIDIIENIKIRENLFVDLRKQQIDSFVKIYD